MLLKNLPVQGMTDCLARGQSVINARCPTKSIAEFIAAAKAQPGKFTFAYPSTTTRLAGELFSQASGIQMVSVPYRTSAMRLADVAGGQVSLFFIDHVLVAGDQKRPASSRDEPWLADVGGLAAERHSSAADGAAAFPTHWLSTPSANPSSGATLANAS